MLNKNYKNNHCVGRELQMPEYDDETAEETDKPDDAASESCQTEIYEMEMVAGNGFAMPAIRIRR